MAEVELLRSLPKGTKRNIQARNAAKTPEVIAISKQFGMEYFDGDRMYGYGGYRYDGRWQPVAKDIVAHFGLKPGDKVLDVGAAKGFLVKDLMAEGIDAYGLDISEYALMTCEPDVIGRLHLGTCEKLPFPDNSFAAAVSINCIHNQDRDGVIRSLKELQRVTGGKAFVQVDAYHSEEQKQIFLEWVLTANTHDYPEGWIKLFEEAGYTGDYYWTVIG